MNSRLVNPRQRMTTLQYQNGITGTTIEFKFDADSVIHCVQSTSRFEACAAGFNAVIGVGFNISRVSLATPANGQRQEGIVHLHNGPHPLLGAAVTVPTLQFLETEFDAMHVVAGTKFVLLAQANDDTPYGGVAMVRWNTVSEWLSFQQPNIR